MSASNFKNLQVDPPIQLGATYSPNKDDRRYLDDQVLQIQSQVLDNLLNGVHSTWVTYDPSNGVATPPAVVSTSSQSNGQVTVISANGGHTTNALGVLLTQPSSNGFSKVKVAISGVLPPAIHKVANGGIAGFVRVNSVTGLLDFITSVGTSDVLLGRIDPAGNLTLFGANLNYSSIISGGGGSTVSSSGAISAGRAVTILASGAYKQFASTDSYQGGLGIVALSTSAASGGSVTIATIGQTVSNSITGLGNGSVGRVGVNSDGSLYRLSIPFGGYEIGSCDASGNVTIDPKTPNTTTARHAFNPVLWGGIPDSSGAPRNNATALANIMALNAMNHASPGASAAQSGVVWEFHDFFYIGGWTWFVSRAAKITGLAGGRTSYGRGGLITDGSAAGMVLCSPTYSIDGGATVGVSIHEFNINAGLGPYNLASVTQRYSNTAYSRGTCTRRKAVPRFDNPQFPVGDSKYVMRAATTGTSAPNEPQGFQAPFLVCPTSWSPGQPGVKVGSVVIPTNASNAWGKYLALKCTAISGGAASATTGTTEPTWNVGQGNAYIARAERTGATVPTNTSTPGYVLVTTNGASANVGQIWKDNGSNSGNMSLITLASGDIVIPDVDFTGITMAALSLQKWNGASFVTNVTTTEGAITWTAYALTDNTHLGTAAMGAPQAGLSPANPYLIDNDIHWVVESHCAYRVTDPYFTALHIGAEGFQGPGLLLHGAPHSPATNANFPTVRSFGVSNCGGGVASYGGTDENYGIFSDIKGEILGYDLNNHAFDGNIGVNIHHRAPVATYLDCFSEGSTGPSTWVEAGHATFLSCEDEEYTPGCYDSLSTVIDGRHTAGWSRTTSGTTGTKVLGNEAPSNLQVIDETAPVGLYAGVDMHDGLSMHFFGSDDEYLGASDASSARIAMRYGPTSGTVSFPRGTYSRVWQFGNPQTVQRAIEGYTGTISPHGPGHRWTFNGELQGFNSTWYRGYEPAIYKDTAGYAGHLADCDRYAGSVFVTRPTAQGGDWRSTVPLTNGTTGSRSRSATPAVYNMASPWDAFPEDVVTINDGAGVTKSYRCTGGDPSTGTGTSAATANTVQFPGGASVAPSTLASHAHTWLNNRNSVSQPMLIGEALRPTFANLNTGFYVATPRRPGWQILTGTMLAQNAPVALNEFFQGSSHPNVHGCVFEVTTSGTCGTAEPAGFATATAGTTVNASGGTAVYTAVEVVKPFVTGNQIIGGVYHGVANTNRLWFMCIAQNSSTTDTSVNGYDKLGGIAVANAEPAWGGLTIGQTIVASGGAVFRAIDPLWSGTGLAQSEWTYDHVLFPGDAVTYKGHVYIADQQDFEVSGSWLVGWYAKATGASANPNGCVFRLIGPGNMNSHQNLGLQPSGFATARAGDVITTSTGAVFLATLYVTSDLITPNLRSRSTVFPVWASFRPGITKNPLYSTDGNIYFRHETIITSTVEPTWRADGRDSVDDPGTTTVPWLTYQWQGLNSLPNACIIQDGTVEWTCADNYPDEAFAEFVDDQDWGICPQVVQTVGIGPAAAYRNPGNSMQGFAYQTPVKTTRSTSGSVQILSTGDTLRTKPSGAVKQPPQMPADCIFQFTGTIMAVMTSSANNPRPVVQVTITGTGRTDNSANAIITGTPTVTVTPFNGSTDNIAAGFTATATTPGGYLALNVDTTDNVHTYSISSELIVKYST